MWALVITLRDFVTLLWHNTIKRLSTSGLGRLAGRTMNNSVCYFEMADLNLTVLLALNISAIKPVPRLLLIMKREYYNSRIPLFEIPCELPGLLKLVSALCDSENSGKLLKVTP